MHQQWSHNSLAVSHWNLIAINMCEYQLFHKCRQWSTLRKQVKAAWLLMPWLLVSPGHQQSSSNAHPDHDTDLKIIINCRECREEHVHQNPWYFLLKYILTHWGRVMHICVGKLAIIGSDNGLSPGRRQAIIWTNAGILLIESLGIKKMHLKMSSEKWWSFCLSLNVFNRWN